MNTRCNMIEIINKEKIVNIESIQSIVKQETTHIILKDKHTQIYENILEYVDLGKESIVTDYTYNGYYINDCRYFGNDFITIEDWFNNHNLQPNIIYEMNDLQWLISNFEWETSFDIALNAIIHLNNIKIESHVIFDFTKECQMSYTSLKQPHQNELDPVTQFYLNKLARLKLRKIPFNVNHTTLPRNARSMDKIMYKSKFKLPSVMYKLMYQYIQQKQMKAINIYEKDKNKIKPYVVFLGFDYGYRGSSKYLYEYFVQNNVHHQVYFVTDDQEGQNFISPSDKATKKLIEEAKVVILESYSPDHIKANGTIIQIWHGTPIKRLFLDSDEPKQNKEIYHYRARKYNKLIKQNYFVTDIEAINTKFQSAFPLHETKIIACGYPRNQFLLENINKTDVINQIEIKLKLDKNKQTILYSPTWRDNHESHYLLDFPDDIAKNYNIIYKYHEEDQNENTNEYIMYNDIETQQLLLVSDIVISDYSSIVFDALTINKQVYLYTPDFDLYTQNRGLYEDVFNTINCNQYHDSKSLFEAINNNKYIETNNKYVNKNNHSFEMIYQLIDDVMNGKR